MEHNQKVAWITGGVIFAVIILCAGGGFLFSVLQDDLREHLNKKYSCTPNPEKTSSAQCTSTLSPAAVSRKLYDEHKPIDRHWDNGNIFFQYEEDIVGIFPDEKDDDDTVIHVDAYEVGYQKHRAYVGHVWPAVRPRSSNGGK